MVPPAASRSRSTRRLWLFRGLSVLLGFSFFVVAELVCRLAGVGIPDDHDDPFVGFSELHPLFVLDPKSDTWRIPDSKRKYFVEDSFPAKKPERAFRIFCLGGSTVQGRPFSIETSFATFLELALREALPERDVDVINCGGISYASYRLVPVLKGCLQHEPDLIVLCTGHNEFLESRTYGHIPGEPPIFSVPHQHLSRLHCYHALRSILVSPSPLSPETTLPSNVQARLDFRNGLKAYRRDDEWRNGVIEHFKFNVNRMLHLARQAGVPVLLVLPPSNLGSAPFVSEHGSGFSQQDQNKADVILRARSERPIGAGGSVSVARGGEAIERLVALDSSMASYRWQLGRHYAQQRRFKEARLEFVAARDHDICPLRILSPMEDSLRTAAVRWNVTLVDAHRLLESKTDDGILGNDWLVDHVHPSISGHRLIAVALTRRALEQLPDEPAPGWDRELDRIFDDHQDSLPPPYYFMGQQRLENLRAWTRGEADGPEYEGD